MRQRWRHAENSDFHPPPPHVPDGLAAALVRYVLSLEAAQRLDAFEGQVLRPALAGRGERQFARIALRMLDELLQRIRRKRRMRDDHERAAPENRHLREAFHRIVLQSLDR